MKRIHLLLFLTLLIGSCASPPTSPAQLPPAASTQTIVPFETPSPTQTFLPTRTSFSITQIRTPGETDGRQILFAFWSQDGTAIYYALINEMLDTPVWFEIPLDNRQFFESIQLPSSPKLIYTPYLPEGSVYLEYQGFVSPSGRYHFQITQEENYSLYLLDGITQNKVKLLETSDMNFRDAYWTPEEKKVAFGIGPEYGTELYFYNIEERKLVSSTDLIGYADWNLSEWALSHDGKYLAIVDGSQNLKVFSTDGSYSAEVPGYRENVRWAGNSERIYFYYGEQPYNPTKLGYFDISTQTTKDITALATLQEFGIFSRFDVSPDGKQLVFWQSGKIWLLSFE